MNILKNDRYICILVEWNHDNIDGERHIFFDSDRSQLFIEFSTYLRDSISFFINCHTKNFVCAEIKGLCERFYNFGIDTKKWELYEPIMILNHILYEKRKSFISKKYDMSIFLELDDLFNWVNNFCCYECDYIRIPLRSSYPDFIKHLHNYETVDRKNFIQQKTKIGANSQFDDDAIIFQWLQMLNLNPIWHKKPKNVRIFSQIVKWYNLKNKSTFKN